MLSGYYTIASGMMSRQREMDVIGNNLVNVQTPGFRGDRVITTSFDQELLRRQEAYNSATLGTGVASTSAIVDEVVTAFNSGLIKNTERNLDMAISGPGFYNIQKDDGTVCLTRNGQFDIDANGFLVLPGIGKVLGQDKQPLNVTDYDFRVRDDGQVFQFTGEPIGALLITVPPEDMKLTKLSDGNFSAEGVTQNATGYTVVQKSLEQSNINMNQELTNLIEVQRAFQVCSSALQIVDGLNRKAASQLASL